MTEITNTKKYNLEDRTFKYASRVIGYVNKLQKTVSSIETGKQLVRSAGSVGANYIEANEALSKKDFLMRIKISRKEAKESHYWLRLTEAKDENITEKNALIQEADELTKIFSAIAEKSK